MSISDMFKASAIKKENETLHSFIKEMGAGDALTVKNKIFEFEKTRNDLQKECEAPNTETEQSIAGKGNFRQKKGDHRYR